MNTDQEGKHTLRAQGLHQVKFGSTTASVPSPSQAETLMSTQEAKERAESKLAEKGKAREAQTTPATTRSQTFASSATKTTNVQTNAPANSPQMNNSAADKPNSRSAAGTLNVPIPQPRTVTAPETPNTPSSTNTLPLKRGPGRPRKSDINAAPPPAKRPRGRPRNVTTPASLARQRNEAPADDGPNADKSGDSDYHDSGDEGAVPPNILTQFNAHVALLRTRLDSRGIPEQYSIYKAFWLATRSAYFDNGATASPGRFFYWDPLFITSVGCPVCQQPLAIAAGGGWLDAPLSLRDEDGPCWIIGRRYVCTQCFAATEEAAKYVPVPSTNPDASDSTSGETKPKVLNPDFSSPVYYLSWEKRFRALLPPTLSVEFPKRAHKRAAFNRASLGIGMAKSGDEDVDMDAEGEPDGEGDGEGEEGLPKRSRRIRHCMKCGSKDCLGRLSRARCPKPCHDCGLLACNGRTKPNVTCQGGLAPSFREDGQDEASSIPSETSPPAPTTQLPNWPNGLPQIPPGFVLAIPYPIGTDGKPTGAQPPMAYLVPQAEVPGFSFAKNQSGPSSEAPSNGAEANNAASTSAQPPVPAPAPAPVPAPAVATTTETPTSASSSTQATQTPAPVDPPPAAQQPQPQPQENNAQSKTNSQPRAGSKQKTPQRKAPVAQAQNQTQTVTPAQPVNPQAQPTVTNNAPQPHLNQHPVQQPPHQLPHHPQSHPPVPLPLPHPHPPPHAAPYPPQHGAPYHPPPPPGSSPEQGYYGFYPYGYMPPYGYGYYQPYPPQGPGQNPPPIENGPPPPGPPYPQYATYPPSGYPAPPSGHPYPPPNGPYPAPPPGASSAAPPNGYNPVPPQPAQPPQYLPYQPPDSGRPPATAGPSTKRKKAPADKAPETQT